MYDYLIVGAGLFGSVCAHELAAAGKRVLVIDRRNHVGGNIYTRNEGGIEVHEYGAHIFHTGDKTVWDYVNRFAAFNNYINSPIAVYKDGVYNLPFNMNTFSRMWGIRTPDEAREIIERQRAETGITEPKNLEEQALCLVGRDIYEKLIKGYTEKQWGRPCSELPADIIRRLPVRFTYDNNYFNDAYQGIPVGGYTKIIKALLKNCELRLNTDYMKDRRGLDGAAEKIIYTGMIDEYYDYRFGELEYRSLRFDTEVLDTDNCQGNAVVNYTEREIPYTRIIEHKHFEFGGQDKTVVTREYPLKWTRGTEPYYPVNDQKNNGLFAKYAALAGHEENLYFGGRLGLYRYMDMDKVIKEALTLSQKLTASQPLTA